MVAAGADGHHWNAAEYHKVSDPQFNWGRAVLARLELRGDERVVDFGCGTGRLTRELAARLPHGTLIGLDASADMLMQARAYLADCHPRVPLIRAALPGVPIANWADLVFSTATFHWVLDHPALFAQTLAALRPGGRLVAQCGGAGNLAAARAPAAEVMRMPAFSRWFDGWGGVWEFADDRVTASRLAAAGFTEIETSLEDAPVVFADEASYRAFVSTVVFRQHLARLPEALRASFLDGIVAHVARLPQRFTLDYRRLNIRASKPSRA